MQIFIILIILILAFALFGSPSSNGSGKSSAKSEIQQYLSEFNMYICIKNKLLFFPPKEINVGGKYHTLNLHSKSKLLSHKNINSSKLTSESLRCTECLHRCPLNLYDIVDLGLSFERFRELSDEEFKSYLKEKLTSEQFESLFEEDFVLDAK